MSGDMRIDDKREGMHMRISIPVQGITQDSVDLIVSYDDGAVEVYDGFNHWSLAIVPAVQWAPRGYMDDQLRLPLPAA